MAWSPVTVNEDFQLDITCVLDSGGPFALDQVTSLVLVFHPAPGSPASNVRFQAAGVVAVTDGQGGRATFKPSPNDKTRLKAGQWLWQVVVTSTSGGVRYGTILPMDLIEAL